MTNLVQLRRAVELAGDLRSIVDTMKTLAAVNSRQFSAAADAIDKYVGTIELALGVVLREVEPEPERHDTSPALVVIGSDQGLCGAFNERVGTRATENFTQGSRLIVVGHRVARRLEADGFEIEVEYRSPGSTGGVTALVSDLLAQLGQWQESEALGGLGVVSARPRDQGGFDVSFERLLPVDEMWVEAIRDTPWGRRTKPRHPHDSSRLFRWLLREWLFASLYQRCARSLAAENAARLYATQAAERALGERLTVLRSRYRTERQAAITSELLDLHR